MPEAFVTAIRTLTTIPLHGNETKNPEKSLPWFPLAGFFIGLLTFITVLITLKVSRGYWPEAAAAAGLIAGIFLTGGIHLDGAADCADGFGGGQNRERILNIMKDSRLGAFGGIALTVILVLKWVCYTRLIDNGAASWIITSFVVSRAVMADMAASGDCAREYGTGLPFIKNSSSEHGRKAIFASIAILFCIMFLFHYPTMHFFASLLVALLISTLFSKYCKRRAGGITGDMLGAACELTEASVLLYAGLII
jgi:adenosylcobinamide-GDP ribazoletransferase